MQIARYKHVDIATQEALFQHDSNWSKREKQLDIYASVQKGGVSENHTELYQSI